MNAQAVSPLRVARRGAAFVGALLAGLVLAACMSVARRLAPTWHARRLPALTAAWFRRVATALELEIEARGLPASGPVLIAANHVSWLDVVALGAVTGAGFVAKAEVAGWPLIGWLAGQGGALFISRADLGSVRRVGDLMTWRLKQDSRLALFPEGITSDGAAVLHFKSRLFAPAVRLRCPVQPLSLVYSGVGGGEAPYAPFVGETSFVSHMWALLRAPAVRVELVFGLPLVAGLWEDRRTFARRVEYAVRRGVAGPASIGIGCHEIVIKPT